ncbi:hypothetical protein LJR225_001345 [Phenylobacterium sp. LjRoot225]|uniref:hypothetical protein n=1 Tax=Phenylobacterium sp. LjRoot225 TaxID=3342285 RepID=UPI003ED09261
MYEFVDRPADRLVEGSRFILWATRGWLHAAQQRRCPPVALAPAFSKMAGLKVLSDFHLLMLQFYCARRCPISLGALAHPTITASEAVLLTMWRDLATRPVDQVRPLIELLLQEPSVEPALAAASRVAAHLTSVGLTPVGLPPSADAPPS